MVCTDGNVPFRYSDFSLGTDCDDNDVELYGKGYPRHISIRDGDGYDNGIAGSLIYWNGVNLPPGYNNSTSGTDCDNDANVWEELSPAYIDLDGDGYDNGTTRFDYLLEWSESPAGYNNSTSGTDCDDNDGSVWDTMGLYMDNDYGRL